MSYGFTTIKDVDNVLHEEILDLSIPSMLYSTIVDKNNSAIVRLPEYLKHATNITVHSVPLDYSYTKEYPSLRSAGFGRSDTSYQSGRYYAIPLPHTATYDATNNMLYAIPRNTSGYEYFSTRYNVPLYNDTGHKYKYGDVIATRPSIAQIRYAGVFSIDKYSELYINAIMYILGYSQYTAAKLYEYMVSHKAEIDRAAYYYHTNNGSAVQLDYGVDHEVYATIGIAKGENNPIALDRKTVRTLNFNVNTGRFYVYVTVYEEQYKTYKYALVRQYVTYDVSYFVKETTAPYIHIDPKLPRCRSYVFITGDLTQDVLKQYNLDVGYGFSDGTKTINQHYSNLFLYEENRVTCPSPPKASRVGCPDGNWQDQWHYFTQYMYWDSGDGGVRHDFITDVIEVPLKTVIPVSSPAICLVHKSSTVSWTFCGFKSNGTNYTHAVFYTPDFHLTGTNLHFSVFAECPQYAVKYNKSYIFFNQIHGYLLPQQSNGVGKLSGGSSGLSVGAYLVESVYAIPTTTTTGMYVRNASGRIVFNSTAFTLYGMVKAGLHTVNIQVDNGTNSCRTLNKVNSYYVSADNRTVNNMTTTAVVAGAFNVVAYSFFDRQWEKTVNDSWFDSTTYYSYTQMIASNTIVCKLSVSYNGSVGCKLTMAPVWYQYVKLGDKSAQLTGLGRVIGALAAVVAAYFGQYELAASLASAQLYANVTFNYGGGIAPQTSAFNYKNGTGAMHMYVTPKLL